MSWTWRMLIGLLCGCSLAPILESKVVPGSDLSVYVTRPDIRSPRFEVIHSKPESITPGYWFVAPYINRAPYAATKAFTPFQIGPHVFDNDGELVWSGAEVWDNRNVYDFRLQIVNGQPALTFILGPTSIYGNHTGDSKPAGLILDTSYEVLSRVAVETDSYRWDLHEFRIVNGNTSISTMEEALAADVSSLNLSAHTGLVWQYGFKVTNINTTETIQEWYPLKAGITFTESMIAPPTDWSTTNNSEVSKELWDCFHTNSVDQNADGDYLVSMRYTSTIYKVSGRDGSIIWRLGGKHSDFIQDFTFSSQHDASFYSYNETVTIIYFLDNASDEADRQPSTAETSSIKVVALHEHATPKRAELLQQFDRPDGRLTKLRGSAQLLPNKGFFAGWSENGYVSEFTPEGRNVLEAKFSDNSRFNTYRAYKFAYVGTPKEPPVLKTFAFGHDGSDKPTLSNMSTVFFVSWNGATKVKSWDFYATNNVSSVPFREVGSAVKSTFETSFMTQGAFWAYAYAEARDSNGHSLARSEVSTVELPNEFRRKYDQDSLAVEAGSLLQTSASHSRLDHVRSSIAQGFAYVTFGLGITIFTFIGFLVTVRWLFAKLRRWWDYVVAKDRPYGESAQQQGEGLLTTFETTQQHDGGEGEEHVDGDEDDDHVAAAVR